MTSPTIIAAIRVACINDPCTFPVCKNNIHADCKRSRWAIDNLAATGWLKEEPALSTAPKEQ